PPAEGESVPGGVYVIDGDATRVYVAGPGEADLAAFEDMLRTIAEAWAAQDDDSTIVPDPVQRRVSRRVSLATSPLARLGSVRRGPGMLDETLGMGDQLIPADISTDDSSGESSSADPDDSGLSIGGRLPSNPMRVLAWTGESEPNNVQGQCNSVASA